MFQRLLETRLAGVVSSRAVDSFSAALESPPEGSGDFRRTGRAALTFYGLLAFIACVLLLYSQTVGFVWDEGFHVLAAQLITRGKVPYLDFCFPQTPLNAYWNAFWLSLFWQSWRITHVMAALASLGSVYLMSDHVFRTFPSARWRLGAAVSVATFIGFNVVVVQFGTVAQAYGIGLLLTAAAFRVAVFTVERKETGLAFVAGLLAGAAAGCTLLTAPVILVLLVWMFVYNRRGNRQIKLASFAIGSAIPFTPVFWLLAKSPRQVFFNVIQYQAIFRRVNWKGATEHDVDVLSAWVDSAPALCLGVLAIAGIWFVHKKSQWSREVRAEFYLCAWLSAALSLYIATAHPTFQRYFIFVVPFAAVLAAVGLFAVASKLTSSERPRYPVGVITVFMLLALGRAVFDERDATKWKDYEQISLKVDQVTPPTGRLYADELVYFLTQRTPPSGMEFSYAHKLQLPPAQEALYHILSEADLNAQVKAGQYDTVQSCKDERIDAMDLVNLYPHQVDIADCSIFWGKIKQSRSDSGKK